MLVITFLMMNCTLQDFEVDNTDWAEFLYNFNAKDRQGSSFGDLAILG